MISTLIRTTKEVVVDLVGPQTVEVDLALRQLMRSGRHQDASHLGILFEDTHAASQELKGRKEIIVTFVVILLIMFHSLN